MIAGGVLMAEPPTTSGVQPLDFIEQVRVHNLMQALLIGVGIQEPRRGSDTAEQGITVLWGEAETNDFMPATHR